jgi:hypothetical protein
MLRMGAPEMEGQGGKTNFRRGRCTGDGGSGQEKRLQARAAHRRWRVRVGKKTSGEGGELRESPGRSSEILRQQRRWVAIDGGSS